MKKTALLFLSSIGLFQLCIAQEAKSKQEVDYVNTIIGTPFAGFAEGLEGGGTIPAVGRPYAMTNFLPQTGESKMGRTSYVYEDKTIMGFLASHQPTVWMGDYGYVSIMPQVGTLKVLPKDRKVPFSHRDEVVSPYYYSVKMNRKSSQPITAEMTATERCGILKFTFPEAKEAHIIIQALNIDDDPEPDWHKTLNSKAV